MDADVVVVGAGMAGLRVAGELPGAVVEVLEAGSEVGGRVRTDEVEGFRCDRGFQLLNPRYPRAAADLDLAALELGYFMAGVRVRTRTGRRLVADPRRHPALLASTLGSGYVRPGELARLARWLAPALVAPQRMLAAQDRSWGAALDAAGVDGRVRHEILTPFLSGVLAEGDGSSSQHFVRLLLRSFVLGTPGLPAGGMAALPRQLAGRLARPVRTGNPAVEVRPHGAGWRTRTAAGECFDSPVVVVATDGPSAARLTGRPAGATRGLVTWWWATDTAPPPEAVLAVDGRRGGGPLANAAVVSNAAPSYAPPGRHLVQGSAVLDGSGDVASEQDARRHAADLLGAGGPSGWHLLVRHVLPDALPAVPAPLQVARPAELRPGLYVCGDHRETASLQGALASGARTGRLVARRLGLDPGRRHRRYRRTAW